MSDLYWLTDAQMAKLSTFFPKSHGKPRIDDRRVLSGIWTGAPVGLPGRAADSLALGHIVLRHEVGRGPVPPVVKAKKGRPRATFPSAEPDQPAWIRT